MNERIVPNSNQIITQFGDKIKNIGKQFNVVATHITPEMFGAKGDGVTDDLQAFKDMFVFMTSNASDISIGGSQLLKDFGKFKINFAGKYTFSNTLILPSCYNLKFDGLYLSCTDNFVGDFLIKSEGIFRNSVFDNCIIDGNWWRGSCVLIESSSLSNKFSNCQFRRFKEYGLKAGDNKGHELLIINSKFNQYEWGDDNENTMPTTQGTNIYIGANRHDNQINNCVLSYCLGSPLKIEGSSNFIENTHFYSPNFVEVIGTHNYFNNCFFDFTTVLLGGLNSIKNSFFMSDSDINFIVLNETNDSKWKYEMSAITGNTFKGNSSKITSPIKALNFSVTNNLMSIYDNTFYNCNPIYSYPSTTINPSPFKEFTEDLATTGYQIIGNIKYMWGYVPCDIQVTLNCSRILNVQITPSQESTLICYATGVIGNNFTPKGEGYVFYFATCVI